MIATERPLSRPNRSSPAWLSTVDTGNPGTSAYGITASVSRASAKSPSPVPRMIPTSGRVFVRARTASAAARMPPRRSLTTGWVPGVERAVDSAAEVIRFHSFHGDDFVSGRVSSNHLDVSGVEAQHFGQEARERFVGPPAFGRRGDVDPKDAVLAPSAHPCAVRT